MIMDGRSLKAVFGVLALVGLFWLFLVGILESGQTKMKTTPGGSFKHMKMIEVEKVDVHPETDLNYMSKRRVPNGPDPIHNRRAGNSGRPPGQA